MELELEKLTKEDVQRIKRFIESDDKLDNKIGVGLAIEKGMSVEVLAAWALQSYIDDLPVESVQRTYILLNKESCYNEAILKIKEMLN